MPELFLVLGEVDPSPHDQYDMHFIQSGFFSNEEDMERAAKNSAIHPGEHTVLVIEWDLNKDGRPIIKGTTTRRKKLKV